MDLNSITEQSLASRAAEPTDTYEAPYKRAPVEIWEAIFSIAIESPLIPYLNDDIVDIYLLFSRECASQRIHRRVERTRTHLRLVCRSWDALLYNKGVKMAPKSLQGGPYQRFESSDAFRCTCRSPCLGSILYTLEYSVNNRYAEPPASVLDSLRIGVLCDKYPVRLLLNAPRLQALHISCDMVPGNVEIILAHRITSTLSHLQLSGISLQSNRQFQVPVKLPRLRSLSLKFTTGSSVHNSTFGTPPVPQGVPLASWLVPRVQTLKLEGWVNIGCEAAVKIFLFRPWTRVTSLYVGLRYFDPAGFGTPTAFEVTPALWASFPSLCTFGTHAASLVKAPIAPPIAYQRFSLVMEFMWDSGPLGFSLRGQSMIPFIQVLDEWKPVNIIFLSTWKEIHTEWKKSKSTLSMWPKGLLATALARDIRLLDVNRTPMCDQDGLECLEIILG